MSRAEGGAGTSRAGPLRTFPAELFRREIPHPLHPQPHGRAALVAAGPCAGSAWTSRAEGGAGTSRADAPRIDPVELFRREIARPLHPRRHGRAALVAAGPCAGPAWTSRAEGGAGASRADAPRIAPAELFRREIPRPLHPRPHGRAALVAAGPCAGPAWTSRAEGGAGTSRADALLVWGCGISLRNCSDVKSRVPYTLGDMGGPRLSRPGPAPPSTNTPPTAKSTASHPRPGARSPRAALGAGCPHGSPTLVGPDV